MGDGSPESGFQSAALALAADGAFDFAAPEHFGRKLAHQHKVVCGGFVARLKKCQAFSCCVSEICTCFPLP